MRKILAVVLIASAYFLAGCINTDYVVENEYHVVRSGETLWEIAGNNIGKQDKYSDIREFIHNIREANGMTGSLNLQAGDCLVIPLHKEQK